MLLFFILTSIHTTIFGYLNVNATVIFINMHLIGVSGGQTRIDFD